MGMKGFFDSVMMFLIVFVLMGIGNRIVLLVDVLDRCQ